MEWIVAHYFIIIIFLHLNTFLVVKIGELCDGKLTRTVWNVIFNGANKKLDKKYVAYLLYESHMDEKKNRFIQELLKCDYYSIFIRIILSLSLCSLDAVQKYVHFHKIIFVWNTFSGFSDLNMFRIVTVAQAETNVKQNHGNKDRKTNRKFSYRL